MVADSEIQRIARLTPLADVLASFDLSVGPVAPREEVLCRRARADARSRRRDHGRPSQGCACAARRLCGAVGRDARRLVLCAGAARAGTGPHRHRRSPARRRRRGGDARRRAGARRSGRGAGRGRARRRRARRQRRRRGRPQVPAFGRAAAPRSTSRCCRRSASSASRCASRACAWCAPARATSFAAPPP